MARTLRLLIVIVSMAVVLLFANGAAAAPPYVYALVQVNGGANQIFGFRLDRATGVLTGLPGFPVATGGTGGPGVLSEQLVFGGGRVFAVNDGSDTLSVFAVNQATGVLTPLPFSPIALGFGDWSAVGVHPAGSPMVVGSRARGLASFVITSTTATAVAGNPFATGVDASPFSIAFSRDGNHVYAGGSPGGRIAGFSVTQPTGVLTILAGSPFDSGAASPRAYATDNAGRLFTAAPSAGEVRVFTTSPATATAGVLLGVAGNPFPSGLSLGASRGVLHPAGFYLVADSRDRQVGVYRISGNGAGTTLTAVGGSPFSTGQLSVNTLALTPEGSLLVAGALSSRRLAVFQVNPSTGDLSLVVQPTITLGATGSLTGLALAPAVTLGDFDADGHADLLWRNNASGQNIGWLMRNIALDSSWRPHPFAAFLSTIANPNWDIKGTGDFDANGRADVIWRNTMTGQNLAWLMDGHTVSLSALLPTIADTNWDIRGVGDFDGNGTADVIWRNQVTGQNIAWLMNGATVTGSAFLLPMPDPNWEIVGVGDLDGNGKADVIWRNRVTGHNNGWLMNGATITFLAGLPRIANTNWEVAGVGDLDGNGTADVVWRHKVTGQNIGWQMNGTTVASSAFLTTIADTNWEIKAVRDVDGDGRADVIWRNKVNGQNIAWLMNGVRDHVGDVPSDDRDATWEIVGPISKCSDAHRRDSHATFLSVHRRHQLGYCRTVVIGLAFPAPHPFPLIGLGRAVRQQAAAGPSFVYALQQVTERQPDSRLPPRSGLGRADATSRLPGGDRRERRRRSQVRGDGIWRSAACSSSTCERHAERLLGQSSTGRPDGAAVQPHRAGCRIVALRGRASERLAGRRGNAERSASRASSSPRPLPPRQRAARSRQARRICRSPAPSAATGALSTRAAGHRPRVLSSRDSAWPPVPGCSPRSPVRRSIQAAAPPGATQPTGTAGCSS